MQRVQKRRQIASKQDIHSASWQTALWGLGLAWVITALGIVFMTAIFYAGWLPAGEMSYRLTAYGIMGVSILAGMLYVLRKTTGRERVWVLAVAAGYFIIRMLLSAILTFL